jgi:hypothetical protein
MRGWTHEHVTAGSVDLYWLPLGAGGRSVRVNGRVYEAAAAVLERRSRLDLYHSALEIRVCGARYVVEMTPTMGQPGGDQAVVEGPVGSPLLGRFRLFRYEVRRRLDGRIPDVEEAVESPRRLTDDAVVAQRVLDLVPKAPTLTWGRDELAAGEMWNSNSLISWLLTSAGLDASIILPPSGGRAPGWDAGIAVARRGAAPTLAVRPDDTRALVGGGRS